MFLTDSEFLYILGRFAMVGAVLAVLWDAVRFIRIAAGGGRIALFASELILTVISVVVVFFCAVEWGGGKLRLYYCIAAVFGMAVYFLTIGMITRFLAVITGKLLSGLKKCIGKYIFKPIIALFSSILQKTVGVFEQLQQKMLNYVKKSRFGLKKHPPILYNNKIGKLCANGGEERNVIKAKVRKKA